MTTKIEAIMKELEANACIVNWILEIPLRQVKMTLEKYLQDTEERECENCKKLQKELDWISFSM